MRGESGTMQERSERERKRPRTVERRSKRKKNPRAIPTSRFEPTMRSAQRAERIGASVGDPRKRAIEVSIRFPHFRTGICQAVCEKYVFGIFSRRVPMIN